MVNTAFESRLRDAKFPAGPTKPRPGPVFVIHARTDERVSVIGRLLRETRITESINSKMYEKKNIDTDEIMLSSIACQSIFMTLTARG